MSGDLYKDMMFAEHLANDHLSKERLVDLVQKLPRHLEFQFLRLLKLDSDHESFPTRFLEERMLCAQFVDLAHQKRAHFRRLPDQIFLIDNFQRSQSTSHR